MSDFEKDINAKKILKYYRELSHRYNIPIKQIEEIIRSQYKFTTEALKKIDFNKISDNSVKTNFSYKYLGKYYVKTDQIIRKNGRKKLESNS